MSVASSSREATNNKILVDEFDNDVYSTEISQYNDDPMKYYEDEMASREPDDPFHILLLDSTFLKSDRITRTYVSGCLTYVLGCPEDDAMELTNMCAVNGMSYLGTWERERSA